MSLCGKHYGFYMQMIVIIHRNKFTLVLQFDINAIQATKLTSNGIIILYVPQKTPYVFLKRIMAFNKECLVGFCEIKDQ